MDMKSIVSSLEKLHSWSNIGDATFNKYVVGLLKYLATLLHFMLVNKHMFEYLWGTLE